MEIIYIIGIIADIFYTYILYIIAQAFIFITEQFHYVQGVNKEIYHNLFNQSPVIRHFGSFQFLL